MTRNSKKVAQRIRWYGKRYGYDVRKVAEGTDDYLTIGMVADELDVSLTQEEINEVVAELTK